MRYLSGSAVAARSRMQSLIKIAGIGNNVTICGSTDLKDSEEDAYCIVDGIVVVKKHGVIPDGTVIGKAKK